MVPRLPRRAAYEAAPEASAFGQTHSHIPLTPPALPSSPRDLPSSSRLVLADIQVQDVGSFFSGLRRVCQLLSALRKARGQGSQADRAHWGLWLLGRPPLRPCSLPGDVRCLQPVSEKMAQISPKVHNPGDNVKDGGLAADHSH